MDYSEGQNNETPFHCQLISAALLHRDRAHVLHCTIHCYARPAFQNTKRGTTRVAKESGLRGQRNDHFIAWLDELEAAKRDMARDSDAAAVWMQRARFVQIDIAAPVEAGAAVAN